MTYQINLSIEDSLGFYESIPFAIEVEARSKEDAAAKVRAMVKIIKGGRIGDVKVSHD